MATSVAFALVDRLLEVLRDALPDVEVYDGSGNSDDAGDYLMVGVSDPDSDRPQVIDLQQTWAGLGAKARDEQGTIACVALSWNGNASAAEARAGVQSITSKVEDALRADPNLGGAVPGLMWVAYGTNGSADLIEATDGTALLWRFDIAFRARI